MPVDPHIDPPLKALFEALAQDLPDAPAPDDHAEIRRRADETMLLIRPPVAETVTVADHQVAIDGETTIRVRTYRPAGLAQPSPTLFFIHGGGWYQGTLDTAEVEMGPLPELVPCATVSVEYRLAPEHPFPAAIDDCLAGYRWMLDHADEIGVDTSRIAIAGTSAGGNLAAALCLRLRDAGMTMPIVQLLDVPALDHTMASPSIVEMGEGAGLTAEAVSDYSGHYLAGHDPRDPIASPLHAADLSGLPPAVILSAENDPIRDDGERYLRALHEAGIPAACFRVLAQPHGGWVIPLTITSRLVLDVRVSTLRRAFAGTLDPLSPPPATVDAPS